MGIVIPDKAGGCSLTALTSRKAGLLPLGDPDDLPGVIAAITEINDTNREHDNGIKRDAQGLIIDDGLGSDRGEGTEPTLVADFESVTIPDADAGMRRS